MSEPTSALSTFDLVLDVALAAGIAYYGNAGNEAAVIPINNHDLEKCLRCVNRGIQMFIASAPATGWRWMNRIMEVTLGTVQTEGTVDSGDATTLVDDDLTDTYDEDDEIIGYYVYDQTQEIYAAITDYTASSGTVTVSAWLDYDDVASSLTPTVGDSYSITDVQTVDGDKARYPLDQDFQGDIAGRITYAADSNRGHLIDWVHETTVRLKREVTASTGYPTRAAVRPWRKRRWELFVDPSPTAGDTLIFPYRVGFNALQIEAGDINTPGATSIVDDSIGALWPDDYFNGWVVHIMSGRGKGGYNTVTDYAGASGTFTVAEWLAADGTSTGTTPNSESAYYVVPTNDRHPAGMQFDDAIRAACLAAAEREFDDLNKGYTGEFLERALPNAYKIDARSAPLKLGMMLPGSRPIRYTRIRKDVEYS
jgi:hypothetical protein